jgi:PPM family protein phosphatase
MEAGVYVEAHALDVHAGDRLLLCSDGLTQMVTNEAIATVLRAESDPAAACKTLAAQANDAGGRDNITAVIVRFDPASSQARGPHLGAPANNLRGACQP